MEPGKGAGGTQYQAIPNPVPQAIVVYCSDPRFQGAFGQFIQQELHLAEGQYIPIVVGGGAGAIGRPESLPKEFRFIKDRLEMHRHAFPSIRRIVLINHEDCKYYQTLKDRVLDFLAEHVKAAADRPREDLKTVAAVFTRLLAHLGVTLELYYARFADAEHTRVVFEPVKP